LSLEDTKSKSYAQIEDLVFKYSSCDSCGLGANRKVLIRGLGSYGADIVLVVDRTSVQSAIHGNLFGGKEGSILNYIIRFADMPTDKLWVTPSVSCPTEKLVPGKRIKEVFGAPKDACIKACVPRLHEEIRIIDPNMLIAMGPSSVKALRVGASFTSVHRRVVEATIVGESVDYKLPVMVIDSILTLLRSAQNPGKIWNKNIADLRSAVQISKQLKEL